MRKTKRFGGDQKWELEMRGEGSSGSQTQEDQELIAAAVAASLITQKSCESQIVNVANKGMVNRYLSITNCSDDRHRNTFSVDHRRENTR